MNRVRPSFPGNFPCSLRSGGVGVKGNEAKEFVSSVFTHSFFVFFFWIAGTINVQSQDKEFHLGLTAEWIEVDLAGLPELIEAHGGDFDSTELYKKITALVEGQKAERTELIYGRICLGQKFSFGSGDEMLYATEYDPPEIPNTVTITNTSADAVPRTGATPTAFNSRLVGISLTGESEKTEDGMISISLSAEDVDYLGRDFLVDPKAKDADGVAVMWMPKFYSMKIETRLVMNPDGVSLAGTFTPSDPDKKNRRSLLFIRTRKIPLVNGPEKP